MAVKTFDVYKLVCGNCRQCRDEYCDLLSTSVRNLRIACINISKGRNYKDNGYELEHAPTLSIDFDAIEGMAARSKRFLELCEEDRKIYGLCKTKEDTERRVAEVQAKLRKEGYDEV